MGYERFIAARLRLSGKGGAAATSIIMAVAGIALAIVIMMAALCIVTGFKSEIRRKVMGFDAHVTIHAAGAADPAAADLGASPGGPAALTFSPQLRSIIDATGLFRAAELTMDHPAVIKTNTDFEGIVMRGLTPGPGADFIANAVVEGQWPADPAAIAISRTTASKLGLAVGDRVFTYFFTDEGVRTRRLTIAAIYDTHFTDYDRLYAYSPIGLLQSVEGLDGRQGNRVDLYLRGDDGLGGGLSTADIDNGALALQSAMMRQAMAGRLDGAYRITSVASTGLIYFNWLALLDTNVAVILTLMALLSGFTLVASLFIIVLERVRTVGILKAVGATNASVGRIFSLLGRRLVVAGMAIGNAVGLALMLVQQQLHVVGLDPQSYYLDYVPVAINPWHIVALNAAVFALACAVLLIPGRLIASISPARSMRYE